MAITQGSRTRNIIDPWLGIYPKDYKSFYCKDACTHMFIVALFIIAKTCNQSKCPSVIDWIKKMWHICTIKYYAAMKNNEIMSFAETWIKLETIILRKLTQDQKTKHHIFSLISECWTMRIQKYREWNITHRGLVGRGLEEEQQRVGGLGRDSIRKNTQCRWRGDGCSKPQPWHMYT